MRLLAAWGLLLFCLDSFAQVFYRQDSVQTIEINFTETDWDYRLDTAKHGSETPLMATWVKVNGKQLDSVAVKYKGNSSFDSTYRKNPLNIDLDTYKNQNYKGITSIKLSNCYADPSMIREVLAYDMLANYMLCPKANFARVYINGEYLGLYTNTESINKNFCNDRFGSAGNTFLKCNPVVKPSPNTKANLKWLSADSSAYFKYYELKSNTGWNDLVALADSLNLHPERLDQYVDIDKLAWMLAFNSVVVNLDSYSGVFCQNYYLYKNDYGLYMPVVWDLNMAFGAFPFAGSGNSSMGTLSNTQLEQMPLSLHSNDAYWPLIKALMANSTWKRMYAAHAKTIAAEMIATKFYQSRAAHLQLTADAAVLADSNKFYSYTQFQQGMMGGVNIGSYTVPGISVLMENRITYLNSTAEFTATQPAITQVASSKSKPSPGEKIYLTARLANADNAWVYARGKSSDLFTRLAALDDGLHGDGAASDGLFGVEITTPTSGNLQYYWYAENSGAGIFSPQRAALQYHSLTSTLQVAVPGQVLISEFLAQNQSDTTDEAGQHEDWVELWNSTPTDLLLDSLYLSDDYSVPEKHVFETGTIIPAYGHLLLWADGSSTEGHANFKLSASGEQLMLSNATGQVFDSLSFGLQKTDTSYGRCHAGGWVWKEMGKTTPGSDNKCWPMGGKLPESSAGLINPNPANTMAVLPVFGMCRATSVQGITMVDIKTSSQTIELHTACWPAGVYMVYNGRVWQRLVVMH